jgi:hypothetical protein
MDQSGAVDIRADLPHRGPAAQAALARVIDSALPEALVRRARAEIARLGTERLRESYFTTFWLANGRAPALAVEEAVLALRALAAPPGAIAGAEWWIGRSYTNALPIDFHFDQDVNAAVKGARVRHPLLSSVFFFNSVRGGQLAITDQRPHMREATRLQAVKPRRNRYALFDGDLLHGVLDARGHTPGPRALPGPRGRLRITLVVNFWQQRPSDVPAWDESRAYRALRSPRPRE